MLRELARRERVTKGYVDQIGFQYRGHTIEAHVVKPTGPTDSRRWTGAAKDYRCLDCHVDEDRFGAFPHLRTTPKTRSAKAEVRGEHFPGKDP